MSSKERFVEIERAYDQISIWEERHNVIKAVVKTWQGNNIVNVEEVIY